MIERALPTCSATFLRVVGRVELDSDNEVIWNNAGCSDRENDVTEEMEGIAFRRILVCSPVTLNVMSEKGFRLLGTFRLTFVEMNWLTKSV